MNVRAAQILVVNGIQEALNIIAQQGVHENS
jgi:hypothetical protein